MPSCAPPSPCRHSNSLALSRSSGASIVGESGWGGNATHGSASAGAVDAAGAPSTPPTARSTPEKAPPLEMGLASGTAAAAALSLAAVAGAPALPASASASASAGAGAGVGARGGAGAAPRSTAHVRERATCLALLAPAATLLPCASDQKRASGSSKAGSHLVA